MAAASVAVRLNAITGDFEKAFSSATRTVAGFEKTFGNAASSLEAHKRRIDAAMSSFGGDQIIREATALATAIQRIGGAATLTAAEQSRVNATVSEALAKYKALGQSAPPALQKLHDETVKISAVTSALPAKTNAWASSLTGLASAFGVTFSIGAVVGFAKEILRAGDEIQKMADKTSIGTENVQRLDFVASQAGVSFEGIVSAVQNLQQRLGDNDKGAIGALGKLGINLDAFLKLDAYEQFVQLSEAVGKISDPTQRAAIAADVFGKAWKEIGPAVISNIREVADSAPVMADATVKAADAAGDALDRFWRTVKANAANQLGLVILSIQALPREVNMAFKAMHLDVEAAKKDVQGLASWWDVLVGKVEKTPKVGISQAVKDAFSGAGVPKIRLSADEVSGIEADLNRERKALDDASRAADAHAKTIRELADTYSGTKAIKDASDALEAVNLNLRNGVTIAEMSEEQQIALNKVVTVGSDAYTRLHGHAKAALVAIQQETQRVIDIQNDAKAALDEWADAVKQHNEDYKRGEEETIAFLEQMEQQRIETAKAALDDYAEVVRRHQEEQKQGEEETLKVLEDVRKHHDEVTKAVHERLVRALGELAQVSGGTFGGMVNDIAGVIVALDDVKRRGSLLAPLFDEDAKASDRWAAGITSALQIVSGAIAVWNQTAQAGSKAAGALHGAFSGANAGAAFGAWGAAIGGAAGAVIGLIHTLSAGRRAVIDFAKSFDTVAAGSGFDELRQKLLALGDEGERLWIKLTQGTKKGDRKGAQSVIDEINAALNNIPASFGDQASAAGFKTNDELKLMATQAQKLFEFMRDSGMYSAEAVQKAWERANQALIDSGDQQAVAAKKAQDAVSALGDKIKSLYDSIASEAPEEVMGIVEQQTRSQIVSLEAQQRAASEAMAQTAQDSANAANTIFDGLSESARSSAQDAWEAIKDQFERHVIHVRVEFDSGELPEGVPAFARGGIVRKPTLALIGERGPEAVVPLDGRTGLESPSALPPGESSTYHVTIHAIDGASVQRVVESPDFAVAFERAAKRNTNDVGSVIRQTAAA